MEIEQPAWKLINRRSFVPPTVLTPEMAYVIGVYLSDGNVCANHHQLRFQMSSIDVEYPETVKNYLEPVLGPLPGVRSSNFKCSKRPIYVLCFNATEFCSWIVNLTNCKGRIPREIPREKSPVTKAFLEGFIDGDGFARMFHDVPPRKNGNHAFEAGFGGVYPWTHDVAQLLSLQGVTIKGPWKFQTRGNKTYIDYRINFKSLIQAGFHFRIHRKQKCLDQYKIEQRLIDPSETVCSTAPNTGDETVQPQQK